MIEEYSSLTKTKKWIGNNPITLAPGKLVNDKEYYITDKLDGIRRLLLFKDSKIYNVSSKLEFRQFKLTKGALLLDGTLLDTEYYKMKYYAFDVLFYNGKDVRDANLLERQEILKKILKKVNSKKLLAKEYRRLECPEVLADIKSRSKLFKEGELDGLIVVPNSKYSDIVFKWKPSNLLSNDFKVKKTSDSLLLLVQNGQIFNFKGYPDIGKVSYMGKDVKDEDVVEFVFENGKFKVLRVRPDKVKSNHISVILDNFKQMTRPAKPQDLFCRI